MDCNLIKNDTSSRVFPKHFGNTNQPSNFNIMETLVGNGLKWIFKMFSARGCKKLLVKSHIRLFCQYSSTRQKRCSWGVLSNFAKFTGKHLCQSLFLIKLQASDWFAAISSNYPGQFRWLKYATTEDQCLYSLACV